MLRRKVREPKEETATLGPAVQDGEHVFGVAHIFASFNHTFIVSYMVFEFFYLVTHISSYFDMIFLRCGMKVKAYRDESSPYAAMLATQDVSYRCKRMLRPFRLIAPEERVVEEEEGYKLAHYVLANLSF
ncbi:hypothetical protein PVK06_020595 [Gossypium arboreum]|uniref:Uncharacterized protein n=1 Tax=Gossypium arboreum TaxID=29729 RepID=A0ABR0PMS1_GOSAR|nr:hypothetical protein PVK06_020595 [Gossypium arboreum]